MFLELCSIFGAVLLFFLLYKIKFLKSHYRYLELANRLPTMEGRKWFLGHAGILLGLTMEEAFIKGFEYVARCSSVFAVFIFPFIAVLNIYGPEETEAAIGQMKNLQKGSFYNCLHRWLNEGLLTSEGSKWHKRRKILTPAFHFSILVQFVDTFNKETKSFIKEIEEGHLDHPVDITPFISNFTLATMSETSMGIKLDLKSPDGLNYKKAIHNMGDIVFKRFVNPLFIFQPIYDLMPIRRVEERNLRVLHDFTEKIIEKRSENFKTFDESFDDCSAKRKYPLLDILLNAKFKDGSIDSDGIKEEVNTFMFEGHDTTASCLDFTTMLLANHKDIQEEVYQEIVGSIGLDMEKEPTYADLQKLALLERCIKESLRLYPPVALIQRKFSENVSTKHGILPKGSDVFFHIRSMHRKPELWPDPEKFDPSRHLPDNSKYRHPYAFIPFSAGPRNCIGQRFAMLEMKAFFCGLLRKFILEPVDTPDTLVLYQDMIMRSRNGIKVKFVMRN